MFVFPPLIQTERLLLRSWQPADATQLKDAIDSNLDHLRAWMPWAVNEPSPLEEVEKRIEKFATDFASGADGTYGVFNRNGAIVIGGSGLHPRIADGFEIGYWVGTMHTHKGYATEAAAALTRAAFDEASTQQVQIRCDPRNHASAAVPPRIGYEHIDTLIADTLTPSNEPRDTMVWQMTRERFEKITASRGTEPTFPLRCETIRDNERATCRRYPGPCLPPPSASSLTVQRQYACR
jgi:RimJ/RimL family protein N-acetyltransferase